MSVTLPTPRGKAKRRKEIAFFMLPGTLLVLLVTIFPIISSVRLSLFKTEFLKALRFIGLQNYLTFFTDPSAITNITASLIFVLGTVGLSLPLGFLLAIVLNRDIRFKGLFRSIAIIPWIIAQVVVALLWKWLLDPIFGPVNFYLGLFGLEKINILGSPFWAMFTLVLANVWRSYPLAMVLILAALQTVPKDMYESATIDGASGMKAFWHITLPLIASTMLITLILLTLNTFNMVTLIYVLTAGGPFGSTEVLGLRVFREAFEYWHLGYATTAGMVIFMFNVVFSLLYIGILKRDADS